MDKNYLDPSWQDKNKCVLQEKKQRIYPFFKINSMCQVSKINNTGSCLLTVCITSEFPERVIQKAVEDYFCLDAFWEENRKNRLQIKCRSNDMQMVWAGISVL